MMRDRQSGKIPEKMSMNNNEMERRNTKEKKMLCIENKNLTNFNRGAHIHHVTSHHICIVNGVLEIRGRVNKVTSYLNVTKRGLVDDHDTEKTNTQHTKHLCTYTQRMK